MAAAVNLTVAVRARLVDAAFRICAFLHLAFDLSRESRVGMIMPQSAVTPRSRRAERRLEH